MSNLFGKSRLKQSESSNVSKESLSIYCSSDTESARDMQPGSTSAFITPTVKRRGIPEGRNMPSSKQPTTPQAPPKPPRLHTETLDSKEEVEDDLMDSNRWQQLDMDVLVGLYNKLLDLSHSTGVSLPNITFPEIAVIGSQSAGKSSVLENIAGEEFLPRGQDTVTRAPLLLHLVNIRPDQVGNRPAKYAVFKDEHGNDIKLTDFEMVKEEILRRFGHGKRIRADPISVYIYLPDTVNLTLYDLPGIIRFCEEQEQIEELTQSISMNFIQKPTTIILAVTSANSEKQDSAAIKMARLVDPKGLRTLHVITKLDLLGPGEDITPWLRNEVFPSHHGVVGVVCRSQQEILDKTPIEKVLDREKQLLEKQFSDIASQHGTKVLRRKVTAILMDKLAHSLPKISREIDMQLKECKTELKKLGPATQQPTTLVASIVNKFATLFGRIIEGSDEAKAATRTKLVGGALIDQLFKVTFTQAIEDIAFFSDLTAYEVKVVAKNCAGAAPGMFAENRTFQFLLRPEMDKYMEPSNHVVDEIEQKLELFITDVENSMEFEKKRYPLLIQELSDLSVAFLNELWENTTQMVQTFFEVEKKYFSFAHDDLTSYYRHYYEETAKAESAKSSRKSQIQITYDEIMESLQDNAEREILTMLFSYIELTKKMVKDHVPKLVMYHLVDHVKENLQQHLIQTLLDPCNKNKIENLVAEPGPVQKWREETKRKLQLLQNARTLIATPETLLEQ